MKSDKNGEWVFFWRSPDMSRHVTDTVIMRINLIVCINRRDNDTFKSLFTRESQTWGNVEKPQSVYVWYKYGRA